MVALVVTVPNSGERQRERGCFFSSHLCFSSILFFLFSFVFPFLFLSASSIFLSAFVLFLPCFSLFFCSFCLLVVPLFTFWWGDIYKGERGKEPPYPIQSRRKGRVVGQLPAGLVPSIFSSGGRPWVWVVLGFLIYGKETGRRDPVREQSSSFPTCSTFRGRSKCTVPFKTTLFWAFFLKKKE